MKVLESEFSKSNLKERDDNNKKGEIMTDDEIAKVVEKLKGKGESIIPKDLKPLDTVEVGTEVTVKIPVWLAKKNKYESIVSGTIKRVTEKAILLKNEEEFWLPKSHVKIYKGIHLKQNDTNN